MRDRNPEHILGFFAKIGDCLLIVEGKRDEKSLNTLGLTNILAINGRPLISVAQKANQMLKAPEGTKAAESGGSERYPDIIILTDFDREGRLIAAKLSRLLRAHKIHPNQRLRSCIMKFGFNKIEDIRMEPIMKMKKRNRKAMPSGGRYKKRGDIHVKTGSNVNKVRCKGYYKGERCSGEAGYHRSGIRPD